MLILLRCASDVEKERSAVAVITGFMTENIKRLLYSGGERRGGGREGNCASSAFTGEVVNT